MKRDVVKLQEPAREDYGWKQYRHSGGMIPHKLAVEVTRQRRSSGLREELYLMADLYEASQRRRNRNNALEWGAYILFMISMVVLNLVVS